MAWICLPLLAIVSFFMLTNGWNMYTRIAMTIAIHFPLLHFCLLYSVLPLCSISIHVYLPFRLSFSGGLKPLKCLFLFLVQIDGHLHSFQDAAAISLVPDLKRIVWVMVMPSRKRDDKKWPNTGGLDSICNPSLFWPWSWHCTPCLPCQLSCKAGTGFHLCNLRDCNLSRRSNCQSSLLLNGSLSTVPWVRCSLRGLTLYTV